MLRFIPFAALLVLALFFSSKTPSSIVAVPWLPHGLGTWLERHDNLKNFASFGLLALSGFWAIGSSRRRFGLSLGVAAGCTLLVVLLELAQARIPGRVSSKLDVATGVGGIVSAWLIQKAVMRSGSREASAPPEKSS